MSVRTIPGASTLRIAASGFPGLFRGLPNAVDRPKVVAFLFFFFFFFFLSFLGLACLSVLVVLVLREAVNEAAVRLADMYVCINMYLYTAGWPPP